MLPTAAAQGEIKSIREAIRVAIRELGDPDASANDIKKTVLRVFPGVFDEKVANDRNWNTYVSQNRDRAAEEMGMARAKRARQPKEADVLCVTPTLQIGYEKYKIAQDFIARFGEGDVSKAKSLLDILAEQDIDQLRVAVDAWLSLVESAGSVETAERVLATLKEKGSIW